MYLMVSTAEGGRPLTILVIVSRAVIRAFIASSSIGS
jgi:hypothetical protein